MAEAFQEKSAVVVVVDSSGAVRQLIMACLKECGYTTLQGVASVKDAVSILEVEPVDWILTPLLKDDEMNALQLVRLICERPVLKDTRISLLLEPEELELLPWAYANGIMTHVEKPFNKDSLSKILAEHHSTFEAYNWEPSLLAASTLRGFFRGREEYSQAIDLDRSLLTYYPGQADLLAMLAEDIKDGGDEEQAKKTMKQAHLVDETVKDRHTELVTALFGEEPDLSLGEGEEGDADVLGIAKAMVVDHDEGNSKTISDLLTSLGVKEVDLQSDGEAAWEALDGADDYGLVVLEWKIHKLAGPMLVQRVRAKYPNMPMVVASSLLTEEDEPLLLEMGVGARVTKPIDNAELTKVAIHTIQQERRPTEAATLENKIIQLLANDNREEAIAVRQTMDEVEGLGNESKHRADGELAYYDGNYEKARDEAIAALKIEKESVVLLNLFGKTLMKLGDFQNALRALEKAQGMSPQNVSRLCTIAEVNAELGDEEAKDKALEDAKDLDDGNEEVADTDASLKIASGDSEGARKIMENMESLSSIISFMNNKAVACARSELYEQGIDYYKQTLAAIPQSRTDYKAVVGYNLALAYARADEFDEAMEMLEEVIDLEEDRILAKARALKKRIETSISTGKALVFNEGKKEPGKDGKAPAAGAREAGKEGADGAKEGEEAKPAENPEHAAMIAAVQTNPGDICCYKIYHNESDLPSEFSGMTNSRIRYTPRDAIAREEAAGLEKLMRN